MQRLDYRRDAFENKDETYNSRIDREERTYYDTRPRYDYQEGL